MVIRLRKAPARLNQNIDILPKVKLTKSTLTTDKLNAAFTPSAYNPINTTMLAKPSFIPGIGLGIDIRFSM